MCYFFNGLVTRRSELFKDKINVDFPNNDDNKWIMYHLNIRGFKSKKKSFDAIMGQVNPSVITLNETGLRMRQTFKISNYKSFNRNRTNGQIMGGVATSVRNIDKDFVLQTKEGVETDEFLITRHGNFNTAINIINIYGEQEPRETKTNIENRWMRIVEEIIKIEKRNEACIVIGDLNKHIGNDDLGVKDNHPKITFGGELVRALLTDRNFILLNNHPDAAGGPFTRYDPAYPTTLDKMACLDLVLISRNLLPYFKSMVIDSSMKFSPSRPISKKISKYSDHFPLIITFENIPKQKAKNPLANVHTIWNTNKEGGWEAFKTLTEDIDTFANCIDEDRTTTENMDRILKKMTKIKFSAFGKVKIKPSNIDKELKKLIKQKHSANTDKFDEDINKRILEIQREEFEKEIGEALLMKKTKGKSAAIFSNLKKICGSKKSGQEQIFMMDPISRQPLFEPHLLKKASLKYCVDLLNNKVTDKEYEKYYFVQDMVHLVRCEDETEQEFTKEAFEKRLKIITTTSKEKYKFLVNAGEAFKSCIFNLFQKIWTTECKPQQWRNTMIVQIYKGKGEHSDFNNQRNIHTKEDQPKLFEGIVVDLSKPKLVQKCSKFQIGGIPGHRPQEHLFTAKSVISLYNYLNVPLFLQLYDISKYFDQEILRDAMDSLFSAGVTGKLYRLWFMLNRDSQIRVKTGFGITDTAATGENVAQGSIGGGIISSLNLDKTFGAHFNGSDSEISYGTGRLSPLLYQDDAAKFSTGLAEAQKSNILIGQAMKMKQLNLNVDKCATIIFGKKKKVEKIRHFIEENKSLTINGLDVKIKNEEKYLGDYFHCGGLAKSVETTVCKRYGVALNSILELKSVIDDFRMHKLGGISSGIDIFNLAILPALIYNSETWLEAPKKTIERLDHLQNILMRCLLAVPNSAPIPALNWDVGLLSMEHKINEKKLLFLHYISTLDESALAKEIYQIQKQLKFPGFVPEVEDLIEFYDLPNILDNPSSFKKKQWAALVKKAIKNKYEDELKGKMVRFSKLKDSKLVAENFGMQDYLKEMNLVDARTNFRLRCSITNSVKMNQKSNPEYAKQLWLCDECGNIDSQSHIMWCPSYATLREGLDVNSDVDVVHYFQSVLKLREELRSDE